MSNGKLMNIIESAEYFGDDDRDDSSDYFSCLSDSEFEDGDDFEDDFNNSDFSLTPVHSATSSVSDSESVGNNYEKQPLQLNTEIGKETKKESLKLRSPIDITFPSKLLDKIKPITTRKPANQTNRLSQPSIMTKANHLRNLKLLAGIETVDDKFNHPIAPIIHESDPFYQINKKYDYNLFLNDQINKASQLQQNPLVSRFFPLGSQPFLPLISEINESYISPAYSNRNDSLDSFTPDIRLKQPNNRYNHGTSRSASSAAELNLAGLLGHHRRASLHY